MLGENKTCEIAMEIKRTYLFLLCGVGIPGNILTIITVFSMQALSPATLFVMLLATYDGLVLVLKLVYNQLDANKIPLGVVGCKLEFLFLGMTNSANWMLVLISAERFISVCYPLRRNSIVTKKRSYIVAAAISVFFFVYYGAVIMITRDAYDTTCKIIAGYEDFFVNYHYLISTCFFLFIPLTFVAIFTTAIIRGLYISRRDRRILLQKGSGQQSGNDAAALCNQKMFAESERVERAITIMVILTALLFLVFSLPACVYILMYDGKVTCDFALFGQIQFILVDSTHALNFFLYFVAAKRFRDQLVKIFTQKFCRKVCVCSSKTEQRTSTTHLNASNNVIESGAPSESKL